VMAVHSLDPSVLTTQSIRASVIIADLDLRVMHVEGPAFDRHGYRPQDWPGRSLNEVLPAGLMAELEPRYRAALAGEPQSFDYWSHDGSGAYWARITPVRGENGAVTSVVAVMQEVTERLGIVEDLSRSEARLRESERMVGVGSWEWVPETRVLTFSSGFARLLGLATAQELDAEAFWGLLEPEDREILSQATRACLRTGVASSEFHARGADGGLHTFAAQAVAVDPPDGQPRYLRGAILDVTQEREAERERLDAVSLFRGGFDASPIGMAMTDPRTGSYTRVNDALCTLLQRPRDELLGLGVDSVTHPDDRAGNEEMRRVLRDPGVESHHVEKRYLRPDGSSVWVIGHVTSVRDMRGSLEALFSQIIDITDRKEHEAQFETQVNDALWLGRIRDAIDNDRLVLYSQPIVDLLTGETVQQELLLRMEAVAQTITGLNFLYVCDKVTILGRTISVAEDPLCPAEPLSRGQRNWPLSDSYNLFGLCNSLRAEQGGDQPGRMRVPRPKQSPNKGRCPARESLCGRPCSRLLAAVGDRRSDPPSLRHGWSP
ncbi:MAG TPA: PAS domain S-box protein, partial [Coriobacteriia bacterium]|nr:PAS domain S-box protein [Coriobacteriia bacterium]